MTDVETWSVRVAGLGPGGVARARPIGRSDRRAGPRLRRRGAARLGAEGRRSTRSPAPWSRPAPRCAPRPSSAATRPVIPSPPKAPGRPSRPLTRQSSPPECHQWNDRVRASATASRRARDRGLCAGQEQRARRREGLQALLQRDAARRRARRRSRPIGAVGEHLEDYPDGAATALREAIGRAFGLDPSRIVCGAGSDDLLNLLARAYLQDRRRGDPHHARLSGLSDRDARRRRDAGGRAGEGLHRRRRRDPRQGDAAHQDRVPRQPEQSDRHLHSVRRGEAPACRPAEARAAGDRRGLCRIRAAQRLRVRHRAGGDLRERRDDAHVLEDLRPRGAAPRLALRPGARRRCAQPHPRAVQRQRAGDRGRRRGDRRRGACRAARASTTRTGSPG